MSQDDQKLIGFIGEEFSKVHSKLNELPEQKSDKTDVGQILDGLDAYAKRADTYFQEMVMLSHKVDRHEK